MMYVGSWGRIIYNEMRGLAAKAVLLVSLVQLVSRCVLYVIITNSLTMPFLDSYNTSIGYF